MSNRVTISETRFHILKGSYPEVPTYTHVDTNLLYEGDSSPFHVVLPIAEIGRVSANGLVYDDELVTKIAEQMAESQGGIRGHTPDDQLDTAFPTDDVHWIGHTREGAVLWAKGYIPPGETRDDVRRKKARGGGLGTSIFGSAVRETTGQKEKGRPTWRARNFDLEQVDLAAAKRAALKMDKGFAIVGEMEGIVPEEITIVDVPSGVREQIIREAKLEASAGRVSELQTELTEAKQQLAEMATYKSIVAEIRGTIGQDADTVQVVAEYHAMATKLAELFGVPYTNVTVRIEEMHEQVAEMRQREFESAIDAQVAELTNWTVLTDDGKAKVAAFRKQVRRAIVGEIAGDATKLKETAERLWQEEFEPLATGFVAELSGPAAIVRDKEQSRARTADTYKTDEAREALKKAWGI